MKAKEKVLGVPLYLSIVVLLLLIVGIIIGSCLDWQISSAFSNPKSLTLEYWAPLFYTWLFPASGVLFYVALGKEKKELGWFLLVISVIYGSYQLGTWLAKQYSLLWTDNPGLYNGMGYLTSILTCSLEAFIVLLFIKKEENQSYMLRLAVMIFIVAIISELIGNFLKGFVSRPRYRNIVAEGSTLVFSPWWEPHFWSGTTDSVRSFPSGHMTATTLIMILPMFHPLWKYSFKGGEYLSFGISISVVVLVGCFRIYNGAHFLSDVCFGILITLICLLVTCFFLFHQKSNDEESKNKEVLAK